MNEIPLNPRAAAAVFMEACDNDVERAKVLARNRLEEARYEELRTILWHEAIDLEIDQLWRSGRGVRKREAVNPSPLSVLRQPAMRPAPPTTSTRALAKGEMSTPNPQMMGALNRRVAGLMHFEMPNGTHLATWTKQNLMDHGRKIIAASQSAMHTGLWLLDVAKMLPSDKSVVQDVLVEADLERLYRRRLAS